MPFYVMLEITLFIYYFFYLMPDNVINYHGIKFQ